MHPVLERARTALQDVLRRDRKHDANLREARLTVDLLPAEVLAPDEILLMPMSFAQLQELRQVFMALDKSLTPQLRKKLYAKAGITPGPSSGSRSVRKAGDPYKPLRGGTD